MTQTKLPEFMRELKGIVKKHEGHIEEYPEVSTLDSIGPNFKRCDMVQNVKYLMDRAMIPEPSVCDKCGQILPR